jgi:hypothetical protein
LGLLDRIVGKSVGECGMCFTREISCAALECGANGLGRDGRREESQISEPADATIREKASKLVAGLDFIGKFALLSLGCRAPIFTLVRTYS